jgi:hypothetical protein
VPPQVRPRISLRDPEMYLSHEAEKRRQRDALRAELEAEREALELQQCTFRPQTTPLPAYLIRRLQVGRLDEGPCGVRHGWRGVEGAQGGAEMEGGGCRGDWAGLGWVGIGAAGR